MSQPAHSGLRYRRAIVTFILAYLTITILAAGLAIGLDSVMHVSPSDDYVHSPSYVLAEKFYPFLNLLVWGSFSWMYFKNAAGSMKEAFALGAFWLAVALPVDYAGFVLIKNPWSLSAHDFYIGQFPWIYLIYVAVLVSPMCWVGLRARIGQTAAA